MRTEKNLWLKALSWILAFTLLVSCITNQVYAVTGESLTELFEQEATTENNDAPNENRSIV